MRDIGYTVWMDTKKTVVIGGGGVGFLGLLALLFIGLKLTGHIDWSWLWVLAPLWGILALHVVVLALLLLFLIVALIIFGLIVFVSSRDG